MTLVIGEHTANANVLSLTKDNDGIKVHIDGDLVAIFKHNHDFIFWGTEPGVQFEGKWNE